MTLKPRELFTSGALVWTLGGLITVTQKSAWTHVAFDIAAMLTLALLAVAYRPRDL